MNKLPVGRVPPSDSRPPTSESSAMDLLAFAFICFVWGSSFIATERASHALGPVGIGVWRLLGGTLVLALLWLVYHRSFRVSRRDWPAVLFYTLSVAIPY